MEEGQGALGRQRCFLALAQGGWATLALNDQRTELLGAPPLHAAFSVVGSDPQGNRLAFELPSGSVGGCPLRSLSNGYCLRLGVVMLEWSKPFAVSSWTVSG